MTLRDTALEWLASKEEDEPVGWAGRPSCCPLAELLKERFGLKSPAVCRTHYHREVHDGAQIPLGPWAAAAVAAVDRPRGVFTAPRPLKAGEVLEAWKEIPE